MNEDAVQHIVDDPDVFEPVPVRLDPVQVGAPEFGITARWIGILTPTQILPTAPKRASATIKCTAATGGAKAIIGSAGQINNGQTGTALNGFELAQGESFTYHAQQPLWVVPDTAAQTVNISVLDERYR